MDHMYRLWKSDPKSVHSSWQKYFSKVQKGSRPVSQGSKPQSIRNSCLSVSSASPYVASRIATSSFTAKDSQAQQLVRAYQRLGHRHANLDPLGIRSVLGSKESPELNPTYYGLTTADLDHHFQLGPHLLPGFNESTSGSMTLREIIAACKSTYCSRYGVELHHINDPAKREWLRSRLEVPCPIQLSRDEKRRILEDLMWSSTLERMLALKAPNEKRFGLDGAETLAPAVSALIDRSVDTHGIKEIIIGSCHRGRLTMVGSVYGKPYEEIFAEFAGRTSSQLLPGMTGDVRSHFGYDGERTTAGGNQVSLSLLANPSHLEAVDPVATGKAYAMQRLKDDIPRKETMCLTLHGDAAFAGQGVVYETLNMAKLPAYDVGGTVRIMVNNQIGFTTESASSRSSPYCSDIAKYMEVPVFHVNADDVEATTFLCQLAADWRTTFHTDCVVDIICYRKFGHQELDLPILTQPLMCRKIEAHPSSLDQYIKKLTAEGSFTKEELETAQQGITERLDQAYSRSKQYQPKPQPHPRTWQSLWSPEEAAAQAAKPWPTSVEDNTLKDIAKKITSVPNGFEVHKNLQRVFANRKKVFDEGYVDWATAEALAFGTLCLEGHHVRVTGQDVQRGTFAHRHAVVHDQASGETWAALDSLSQNQAPFSIANSPLSEFAPLGFEYGFTLADPSSLVVWEAQFGDFANNAQVVIDNFIANAEYKWMDRSGLVLSLPHGNDGQGPEHSSARLERFLMLCNEEGSHWPEKIERQHQDCNMQVVYITSPANYFHVLRRQLHREYRKRKFELVMASLAFVTNFIAALIVLFSKSLLRHPLTVSRLSEFSNTSAFRPVLADPNHGGAIDSPENISRLILCTGQVYASLDKHREATGIRDTAITRIEELHPFPWAELQRNLDLYPNVKAIVWAQEEAYNGGAWHYVRDRIDTVLRSSDVHRNHRVLYAGRPVSATTAAGLKYLHAEQADKMLKDAFSVKARG